MTRQFHATAALGAESETDTDHDWPWAENVVAFAGTVVAVLFMLSVAVVMYLA